MPEPATGRPGETATVLVVDDDPLLADLTGEWVREKWNCETVNDGTTALEVVEDGFDVVELPFDDYLKKPIDRPTLQEKVEALLLRRTYHPEIREFFASVAKLELLKTSMPAAELADDERYLRLKARAVELRQASDAILGEATEHVAGFNDVNADE